MTTLLIGFAILFLVFVAVCNARCFYSFEKEQELVKMVPTKKITVGVFFGLMTVDGRVILQRRTEKTPSQITGQTYQGDLELPGGKAEEKNLRKLLTISGLLKEAKRELREELGFRIVKKIPVRAMYLAVFVNKEKGTEDWAFMIPVSRECWNFNKPKREIETCGVEDLDSWANMPKGDQLLSGPGKRMHRMSLAAIFMASNKNWQHFASDALDEIKSDWRKTELLQNPVEDLASLRKELGIK